MKSSSVALVLLTLLSLSACVSIVGGPGGISPSQFQFRSIVPLREPGPGGWKSARVIIQLVHMTERGVRKNIHCGIEVQVPQINEFSIVTDEFAQLEAARAAERTLKQEDLLTAEMCKRFRDEMQSEMREFIPGTRIIQAL
ncbi:MAG: hypothetical protein JXB05_29810 [Myxococcaceae bacterium]|nr:hypothetical protein [Myxococcaceae bacterium]